MTTPDRPGAALLSRLDELGAISEEAGCLTRIFLSAAQADASARVAGWMRDAGMAVRIDAIGNVVGRYEGVSPGRPALVLGSHLDTVRNAGKYDGPLGVVTAIAGVAALHRAGERLDHAVEVIGFSDEEGVRFGTTLLGSRAVAGTFDPGVLARQDAQGVSMSQALRDFGLDPAAIGTAARRREEIAAYVELHIEQGPVLQARGLAVGNVTSISGAGRFEVAVAGMAGHAGTVPMPGRRDALAAACACVLALERRCRDEDGLVGTVGRLEVAGGAINVIPGDVRFTLDIRAPCDTQRRRCEADMLAAIAAIAAERGVQARVEKIHDMAATPCAGWLQDQIDRSIAAHDIAPFRLPSGAGHDGAAMRALADIGMIFVRCTDGISHNPAEAISDEDAAIGARVLLHFIRNFRAKGDS
jgi:allantoate deiminase